MGFKELIAKIEEKAQATINQQNQQTNQELEKIKSQFEKEKTALEKAAQHETEKALDLLRKKNIIPARLQAKSSLLKAKRELIDQVFNQAKQLFIQTKDKEYATILKLLIKKNPLRGKAEITSSKAKEKITKTTLNQLARQEGFEVTFLAAAPQLTGGFIAKQGLIDLDYSFETYFESIRKELEDAINLQLFKP